MIAFVLPACILGAAVIHCTAFSVQLLYTVDGINYLRMSRMYSIILYSMYQSIPCFLHKSSAIHFYGWCKGEDVGVVFMEPRNGAQLVITHPGTLLHLGVYQCTDTYCIAGTPNYPSILTM